MKRIILLLLVFSFCWISYGEELNSSLNELAKKQVESKFLKDKLPVRYYSNILILLQGYPTSQDSLIFNELVDTLNVLIDKWDVALIPNGTSNLEFGINIPFRGEWKTYFNQNPNQKEIIKSTIYLHIPDDLDFTARKKIIYYTLLRSLVIFKSDIEDAVPVPGSVFSESEAEKMTFHPVDFEIIKELYSLKYEDTRTAKNNSTISSAANKPNYQLIFNLIAQILSFAFLIFMALKGAFSNHHYQFEAFMKQGALVVAAIAFYSGILVFIVGLGKDFPGDPYVLMLATLIGIFIAGIIIACLVFLIERAILKKSTSFSLEIMVPFLTIAFVTTVLLIIFQIIIPGILTGKPIQISLFIPYISSMAVNCLLIGLGRAIFIFSSKTSEGIIRKKDLELAIMSELHKQAELQSLRAKINPHFLYNALNSIASLATTDGRKTEQMALSLSDFFKYSINREQKQLNTLSEELNATRTYLEIEKVRFGDRLSFQIDCPMELLDIQIPQLLIQPLVENAIKHGLSQITENGLIRIVVSKSANQLKIRVYDNGPAFTDGPLTGFGIQNTQERIALLYGAKATINWQNGDEKMIEISLPL